MINSRVKLLCWLPLLLLLSLPRLPAAEPPTDTPLPGQLAAKQMKLPAGFQATLFAGEPDLVQPIAFTFDERGRLWAAECLSYPVWAENGRDRISVFADTDGDGRFDQKKVFWDQGNYITGVEIGFGGVWVLSPPRLLFIPDADRDDLPDGPPQTVLDGWSHRGTHNIASNLTWGPDGWLYGCNGCSSPSWVGKPGTPQAERDHVDGGVWRLHPASRRFEIIAAGTCNPWGLDFNDVGEAFLTTSVVDHLWHVVPGVRFRRKAGRDFHPFTYELVGPCCDHIHWGGGSWQESRNATVAHGKAGGGHAHAGAMIYQGDNWPAEYRNQVFMVNIHGRRVNRDSLSRHGSGYVGRHEKDFMFAADPWFRGVALKYGPDGAVYLSDWNDTGECHDRKPIHRQTGRIYKIKFLGDQSPSAAPSIRDLSRHSAAQLVALHLHSNEWYVRQSRRLLLERNHQRQNLAEAIAQLRQIYAAHADRSRRLRAMWTLSALGQLDHQQLMTALEDDDEYVRVWAIRFAAEDPLLNTDTLNRMANMAATDDAQRVRLELASILQRLPLDQRWPIAEALVTHAADADDANLPYMIWYGIEPLVAADTIRAVKLAAACRLPLVRRLIARRMAEL